MPTGTKSEKRTFLRVAVRPVVIGLPVGAFLGALLGFLFDDNPVSGAVVGVVFAALVVALLVSSAIHAGALGAPRRWPFQPGDEFMGWMVAGRLGTRADRTIVYDVRRTGQRSQLTVLSIKDRREPVAVRRDPHPLASVTSPYIVPPLDIGTVGEYHYVIVPPEHAEPLAALVDRAGPLDGAALFLVALGIAVAVRHAHESSAVHGKIRPDQVATGGKLYGFDPLARYGAERAFLAPEQKSDPATATPAADVFALASTVYFAAAGQLPHGTESAPDWPDTTDWLRPVFAEAFAAEPDRRPDAATIVDRLHAVGTEHGWRSAPPAPAYPPGLVQPWRPGRGTAAVVASIVLIALLPFFVPQGTQQGSEQRTAERSAPTTDPEVATRAPTNVTTTRTDRSTVDTTGGTREDGWPAGTHNGSTDFLAYLGASRIAPDWVSCADGYCLVGSADRVRLFTDRPFDQIGQTALQTKDPRGSLTDLGLRPEQADRLLGT